MKFRWPSEEQWLYLANMGWSKVLNGIRNGRKRAFTSILCVKLDEIGDMATCLHVFSHLKAAYPQAHLTVLCNSVTAVLLRHNAHIDQIITDFRAWNRHYELVVELRGNWRTLFRSMRFWPQYRLDRGSVRFRQRGHQPHELETNYRIIAPLPGITSMKRAEFTIPDDVSRKVKNWLEAEQIGAFAVLHTGARRELRRWPAARFASLAEWLWTEHQLACVLPGSADEIDDLRKLARLISTPVHLFPGTFPLDHLPALLQQASIFVGNESGPLHLACAVNIPVVGIFGPGVKDVFYPWSERSAYIHHVLPCNPCDQIHCVSPDNPCIRRVGIKEVQAAVEQLIGTEQ
jgi:ADP-heptose:LPS heptosyltransferase